MVKSYRIKQSSVYREYPSKNHTLWINGRRYIDPSEQRISEDKRKLRPAK